MISGLSEFLDFLPLLPNKVSHQTPNAEATAKRKPLISLGWPVSFVSLMQMARVRLRDLLALKVGRKSLGWGR